METASNRTPISNATFRILHCTVFYLPPKQQTAKLQQAAGPSSFFGLCLRAREVHTNFNLKFVRWNPAHLSSCNVRQIALAQDASHPIKSWCKKNKNKTGSNMHQTFTAPGTGLDQSNGESAMVPYVARLIFKQTSKV
jgi:hypothetical protein